MTEPSKKTRSEGKIKALDVLDKHITQRSALKKTLTMNGQNVLALNENMTLNPAPALVPTTDNVYQRSPTPRNRRDIAIKRDRDTMDASPSPLSSPIRKGVSFSDQIESSPIEHQIASSPMRPSSMTKPPSKSILKQYSLKVERSSLRGSPRKPTHLSIDPFSPTFWPEGEILRMINPNNVAEFRKIIEGGIHVLNSGKTRDFEIFASFNNIVPSMNGVILNDVVHHKIEVIIENLEPLLNISLTILKNLQNSLLLQLKKDPFKSRCYIQVVRFLTVIFSNFKVIKHLDGNLNLQLKFTEVLKKCEETLTHKNTSKVMVIYPLTLLKEEKFGQFYLPDAQIKHLVHSVFQMRYIDSSNVQCERLMVLKQFLQKYNKIMIKSLPEWFPVEIAGRYLAEEKLSSPKIRSCCNLLLLDLLRKSITSDKMVHDIHDLLSIPFNKIKTLPQFSEDANWGSMDANPCNLTLLEALCKKLKLLIDERDEYKLSMDYWLGIVGLLFNTPETMPLLLQPVGSMCLEVNSSLLQSQNKVACGTAIKSRRIINFMIVTNLTLDMGSTMLNGLLKIILEPFNPDNSEGLYEYLTFLFNGLMYLVCCDNRTMSPKKFEFLYKHILVPLFSDISDSQLRSTLGYQAQHIFSRILRSCSDDEGSSPRRSTGFQPLKALSTNGVDLTDFEPMDNAILENNWSSIVNLLKSIIDWSGFAPQNSLTSLQHLIRRAPSTIPMSQTCCTLLDLLSLILNKGKIDRNGDAFKTTIRTFAEKFELHLFDDDSIFLTHIFPMNGISEEEQFNLFKEILQQVKPFVKPLLLFGCFHSIENSLISNYTANIVGSMLLPTNMSDLEYKTLLKIVNKTPIPEIIDNLFTWLRKTGKWKSLANELNLSSWDDHLFANFIQKWLQEQKNTWSEETINMISESLWRRPEAFKQLSSILINSGQIQPIKDTLTKNPDIIDDISLLGDLPLLEVLPKPLVISSFTHINQYDDVIKTKLFLCACAQEEYEVIRANLKLLHQLLVPTDDDVSLNNDRNVIIDLLIKYSISNKFYDLVSMVIEVCLLRKDVDRIIEIFSHHQITFSVLEAKIIAMMVNNIGKLNSELIEYLRNVFISGESSYGIAIMEELLKETKYQVFNVLREDVLKFSFNNDHKLTENEKERLKKIFPLIVDYYVEDNSKSLIDIMKIILNIMKTSKDKQYGTSLVVMFLNHSEFKIQGNKTLMKKLNVYKANAKRLATIRKYQFISPNETRDSPAQKPDVIEPKTTSTTTPIINNIHSNTTNDLNILSVQRESEAQQKPPSKVEAPEIDCESASAICKVTMPETKVRSSEPTLNAKKCDGPNAQKIFIKKEMSPSDISVSLNGTEENESSNLPVKIPIFNPFGSDIVKLEDEIRSGVPVPLKRSRDFSERDTQKMKKNKENEYPPLKIQKLVDNLSQVSKDDVNALKEEDRRILRKAICSFMLELEK